MPPAPSGDSTSYGPSRVPVASGIEGEVDYGSAAPWRSLRSSVLIALAAALTASTPGIAASLWGRRIAALPEDPALTERYFAYRLGVSPVPGAGGALIPLVTGGHALLAASLAPLPRRAGAVAYRKG